MAGHGAHVSGGSGWGSRQGSLRPVIAVTLSSGPWPGLTEECAAAAGVIWGSGAVPGPAVWRA